MTNTNKNHRFTPIYIAIAVVLGMIIGSMFSHRFTGSRLNIINNTSNKLNDLMCIIEDQYVDTVSVSRIVEQVIPKILAELDPHSSYINVEEASYQNDDLKGSFSGIGVQFTIRDDTVYFTTIIKGSPAEKVGLLASDRLISVDGKPYAGKNKVSNRETMRLLKGEKGSHVKLGVLRGAARKPMTFDIIRGDIPVTSISATYLLEDKLGYIKVDKFSESTYNELLSSLAQLESESSSLSGLVVDLRGNGGGNMAVAIQMINEFLPKDHLIVYTKGLRMPQNNYTSDGRGSYQKMPIIVLTDEFSASASEIFAGAIQDNDRGIIIGRRTFGKGLVQQPITFTDGSIINLTVARYYTPSGRCVQKPYKSGDDANYTNDLLTRFEHGEFFSEDSIKQKGEIYKTSIGRQVYGGGGIMPDVFVPEDTTQITNYFREVVNSGLVLQFAFNYTDTHRETLAKLASASAIDKYLRHNHVLEQFIRYCDKEGVKRRNNMIYQSRKLLEKTLYASIIYNALDMEQYVKYVNTGDKTLEQAIKLFNEGKTMPTIDTSFQKKINDNY